MEIIEADEKGILQSQIFPGLWLSIAAFWAGNLAEMLQVLQEWLASPEHAAFIQELQQRKEK